ncbi:MAG TPA: acetyl-CoA carboxylase biotin carboxyl carrier protein subunit, partial [Treponemataceae bacterium]|nr:acetyl-CoA carboxylase biotin carboxyl carrier protein subunit [Treponemataceae bacterium]
APQAAPSAPQAAQAPSGGTVIPAPVAGTYLKATVADGAQVSPGQTIIMIESMKMELEVKATDAGTVHFLVNAGTAINAGQALAEIK